MKKLLFLLICLCCIGLVSATYAQDMDDDDLPDEISAPQANFVDDAYYSCTVTVTGTPTYTWKSMVFTSPLSGVKKIFILSYHPANFLFSAIATHKIKGHVSLTASSINTALGINIHQTFYQNTNISVTLPPGVRHRVRMRAVYQVVSISYTCHHRFISGITWHGTGKVLVFGGTNFVEITPAP